jgi:23S rRNA (pseudouridine1915-N3)-methyltransferase
MKLVVLWVHSSQEEWVDLAIHTYAEKIRHHEILELLSVKSIKLGRGHRDQKIKEESESILKLLKPTDLVILCDPKGITLTSEGWSSELSKAKQSGCKRWVLIIGGAFGVSESLRQRAQKRVTLSPMILNHHIALIVALEQIYRAISIEKKLPYHNP